MAWPRSPDVGAACSRGNRALVRALVFVALVGTATLAPTGATWARTAYVDSTVRYLQEAQNLDGGFGGAPNSASDPDFSAWATIALASAGINPQDQSRPGGASAFTYLLAHASELERGNAECAPGACTTELDRTLLVVDAAGTSPRDFNGVDLQARLLQREQLDGGFPHTTGAGASVNDTVFAILALSPLPGASGATQRAAEWLLAQQDADGSWPITCPRSLCSQASGEVDATAAAVQALDAVHLEGEPARSKQAALAKALEYLRAAQRAEHEPSDPGGLPEVPSEGEANVASSAWAAQALWSDNVSPETWTFAGGNPLTYMISMQQPDGHIRYRRGSDANPVWMTAYVLPAFSGVPLPIVNVPRNPSPPTPSGVDEGARPGVTPTGGQAGVLAGGGGRGAPDFSRPQPRGLARAHASHRAAAAASTDSVERHEVRSAAPALTARGAPPRDPMDLTHGERNPSSSSQAGVVSGILIARMGPAQQGAPGLRGARGGVSRPSWLAIAIASAALVLAALGARLERRRPIALLSEGASGGIRT
jgi:prenyltransferase beta subunit